jgi:hypothetical protein
MADEQDTAWRDALTLTPGSIAGVPVRPLSAWHMHAMTMLGVKWWIDANSRGPRASDVLMAIPILRSRWGFRSEGIPCPSRWLKAWLIIRRLFIPWQADAKALVRFVARYNRHPEIEPENKEDKDSTSFGCPPYFAIAVDLAQRIPSVSLVDALNMPICHLHHIRATALELAGVVKCSWSGEEKAKRMATVSALSDPALLAVVESLNTKAKL